MSNKPFITKAVVLAGGSGTRLRPATLTLNKHLIPILNKPMITYPLETVRALGVEKVLLVSGGDHIGGFAEFLKDGSEYGLDITYKVQNSPGGIAHALRLAEDFYADDVCMQSDGYGYPNAYVAVILGDNIFDTQALVAAVKNQVTDSNDFLNPPACLFSKEVANPQQFGVIKYGEDGRPINIVEKPIDPPSNNIVTGFYLFPLSVFGKLKILNPSARGELEISDVNNMYLNEGHCQIVKFTGFWSDAGTPESLYRVIEYEFNSKHS